LDVGRHDNSNFSYANVKYRRTVIALLSCAGLLSAPGVLLAQSLPPGDHELQRQRQEQLLDTQRQRLNELQRRPAVVPPSPPAASDDPRCFPFTRIDIDNAPQLNAKTRAQLLAPFSERCLTPGDIDTLLHALTEHYLRRGYITTRAYLPEQNLGSGLLKITVLEGTLETLQPAPGSDITPRELNTAFPGHPGQILNLREIEQLLDQLNRLPSRQSRIELEPGSQPGASRALIHTPSEKTWRASLSRHNQGETSTGRQLLETSLAWDTPLHLADQINLRAARSLGRRDDHGARNASLAYNLPWGWWNLAYHFLYSDYNAGFNNGTFHLKTAGKTRAHHLRLDRTLHRGATHKTALSLALDHTAVDNTLEDIKLDVTSPRLTEAGLSLNHSQRLGNTYINLDLGWQRGLSLLGADHDRASLRQDDAHAQYNKYTLTASLLHPLQILSQPLTLESLATWQKSEDTLHNSRRVSLGGPHSVRGFQDQSLTGDTGGYWRTQLTWAPAWHPPHLNQISATLAWDIGKIKQDRANHPSGQYGTLSGYALELSARARYARASLILARTDKRPDRLARSEAPVWFRLDLTY
jgi:hemolysin activation/secretion protein